MEPDKFGKPITIRPKTPKRIKCKTKPITGKIILTPESSPIGEEKILNLTPEKNAFLYALDVFEKGLRQLTIDNDEEIYKKLLQLQELIRTKLLTFKHVGEGRSEHASDTLFTQNLISSKSLASCLQSLCSKKSVSLSPLDGNDAYEEFLSKVNCPFCSEGQIDKINLIKHLDENCQSLIKNVFEKRNFIPFSAFQILPNNCIKCNVCHNSVLSDLNYFFLHLQNPLHKKQYVQAQKSKDYTESLFCSCCKVLVPNNYTQLNFHMQHKVHKIRGATAPHSKLFKNADFAYLRSKRFKCLTCPSGAFHQTPEDILKHFDRVNHRTKFKNGMFPVVFCEICTKEVNIFQLLAHLNSDDHKSQKKSLDVEDMFELCYYCGYVCKSLMELSLHVKGQCKEITCLREQNLKAQNLCKINPTKNESGGETKIENYLPQIGGGVTEGGDANEVPHIIVKDCTDLQEVYRYFKEIGEITGMEIYKKRHALIRFRDKSAVEEALLLRDVIHLNGVKMEITIEEKLVTPGNASEGLEKEISFREKLEIGEETDSGDRGSTDEPPQPAPNRKLEALFERVLGHLCNSSKILDSEVEKQILQDCATTVDQNRKCSVIGFAGNAFSSPTERIFLYCDTKELEKDSDNGGGDRLFHANLVQKFYLHFISSLNWDTVKTVLHIWPHIECRHSATDKSCSIFFSPSAKILTDMLRHCMEVKGAENLCRIVIFWLTTLKLSIGDFDFVVMSLLVFFLINGYVKNDFIESHDLPSRMVSFCQAVDEEVGGYPPVSTNKRFGSSNVQMFQEFLEFIIKFNFKTYMIILPINYPVPKEIFKNFLFHAFLDKSTCDKLLDSAMCILDPLLSVNLCECITQQDLESLLEAARNTLKTTD